MQGEAKKAAHKRLENLEYKRLKNSCTSDMATRNGKVRLGGIGGIVIVSIYKHSRP